MIFLNAWALIGLIGVPILILIYIIKHRYREEVVPSTFLWKKSLKYMKRRLPFNLKNLLLLLLQLLAITLSVLVIARPAIPSSKTNEIIAIVDTSASMKTVGADGKTRLERAKAEIARLAEDADENNPMSVIVTDEASNATDGINYKNGVIRKVDRSSERLYIIGKLDEIEAQWGETDINRALEDAQKIREDNVNARIIFFTDTVYDELENVETYLVTDGEWNAAVLGLEVEQLTNGAFSFKGKVASYGRAETLNVVLYIDGEYVQAKKVDCADGVETEVAFREYNPDDAENSGVVNYDYAEIRVVLPEEGDSFSYDDSYMLHRETSTRKRVQVVFASSAYDEFLPIALSAAEIEYQVVKVDSLTETGEENRSNGTGGYNPSKFKYEGYAAYIFVGIVPEKIPTDGATWLINPPRIPAEFGVSIATDETQDPSRKGYNLLPVITNSEEDKDEFAILKGMTFTDQSSLNAGDNGLKVLSYKALTVNERGGDTTTESNYVYKTLMGCEQSDGIDALFLVGKNTVDHRRVMISSLTSSNLTASLEYTLLVNNLFHYASPDIFTSENRTVGDNEHLTLPAGTIGVEVIRNGTTISLVGRRGYNDRYDVVPTDCDIYFDEPGDYTIRLHIAYPDEFGAVTSSSQQKQVDYGNFVSLPAAESDSHPEQAKLTAALPENGVIKIVPMEIWFYLLIALMVVLMAEWWVYYRA